MPMYDDAADELATSQLGMPPPVAAPIATQASKSASPYDEAADLLQQQATQQRAQAALTIGTSIDANPDRAAANRLLAKRYNTTPDVVDKFPDDFRQRMAAEMARTELATAPKLQQTIAGDPTVARVIHDDVPNTAAIERAASTQPGIEGSLTRSLVGFSDWLGARQQAAKAYGSALAGDVSKAAGGVNLALGALPVAWDAITGGTEASDWWFKNMVAPQFGNADALAEKPGAPIEQKIWRAAGNLTGMLAMIYGGGGGMAAPAVAEVKTVSQAIGNMFAHGAAAAYPVALSETINTGREVYAQTGSMSAAATAMETQYGASTLGLVLPIAKEGGLFTRIASGFASGVVNAESSRAIMNTALPASMQQPNPAPEDILLSGLVSGALGGIMGPRATNSPGVEAIRQQYAEHAQAEAAAEAFNRLQAISQLSAASKFRERDPAAFKQYVESVTEDGNLEHVYVGAHELAGVLDQAGITADKLTEQLPDVAAQMKEALETNGDVRIPVADYATHIAGGPADAALLPHLKADPEGKTYAEAQTYYQEQVERFKQSAQAAIGEKASSDAWRESAKSVENEYLAQLNATGRFPADVNKAYAALAAASNETMAARRGVTPEEHYVQYPLDINAAADSHAAQRLSQGVAEEPPRGQISFERGRSVITLLEHADLSTFLHELGHFNLEVLSREAAMPDAHEGIKSDMGALLDWFGVKDQAAWDAMSFAEREPFHEKFAAGFERYLQDGKAPSLAMQPLFNRFRAWLLSVYRNLTGQGVQLTPEVRGVMDRMLASEAAIKEAEAVRGYAMPFADAAEAAKAGVDAKAFAELQSLHQEATDAAIGTMQAKSIRDMKWLTNAKSRAMKVAQRAAKAARETVRGQVAKEVAEEPIEQARRWLKTGEMKDAEGNDIKAAKGFKLNAEALKALYPEGRLDNPDLARIKSLIAKDGLHPDIIAEMFGFRSGDNLVRELASGESAESKIEGLTDKRMLEEHGELSSPDMIERSAEAAIHNEVRSRFMATGLKVLAKSPVPARSLLKGAKEAAEAAIAAKRVGDVDARQYEAAEAKANKQVIKLAPKDTKGAVEAQRAALLNNQLAKAAGQALDDVRRILTYVKRFDKKATRDKIPGSFLQQIDNLLNEFDFRKVPTEMSRPKENLLQWANGLRELGYEPKIAEWLNEFNRGVHYKDLTVEQLRGLFDTVRSIEAVAKSTQEIRRGGERVLLDTAVAELKAKMEERGERFTKEELINPPMAKVDGIWKAITHWIGVHMRMSDADLLPQEYKINRYDLHDLDGPFREMLLDPILTANYAKVDMTREASLAAQKVGEALGRDWQARMYELVDNSTLRDPRLEVEGGKPVFMKITRAKLLGIMRHMGNESNFDKLIKGYQWKAADVWAFVHEHATAKDWQATQAHWDAFDPLWKKTEEMYERLSSLPPPKIPPREFDTRFGKMRGGYSPIDYDPVSSKLSERQGEFDLAPGDKLGDGNMLYRATTTSNGSMVARSSGYTDYVNLDIHSAEARIRDTIHDIAYREALLDAGKIVNHRGFREKFMLTYGKEEYQALQTWLRDVRDMYLIDSRNRGFENALQYTRQGVIMTGIAYRISTVVKHGSSAALKSLGYLGTGEGAKHFAAHVTRMASGHSQEEIAGAKEKFEEIRTRMLQMDRDYKVGNRSMYEGESWRDKNDRFGHAMVAWGDALSAIPTAWAAYDLARTTGVPENMGGSGKPMDEAAAVKYANSVVRQAHGTALEAARSNFMQARGAKGLFGTIYGFMNNTYAQTRDMFDKAFSKGAFENNPALVARALTTIILPALAASWAGRGSPDDTKEPWYKWAGKAVAGEVAGMVPFVRDAWSMIEFDHADQSVAPIRLLSDAIKSGRDIVKELEGNRSKLVQDLANTIGEWAHIGGLGQAGKTLQYLRDVQAGREHPESVGQFIHDATLGPKHAH